MAGECVNIGDAKRLASSGSRPANALAKRDANTGGFADERPEDEFAFAEIRDLDASRRWWMGYNDRRREGVWEWEDGTPSGYENWGGGEPNDTGAGEDCGQLNRYTDGGWNDEPCANSLPFVCELD